MKIKLLIMCSLLYTAQAFASCYQDVNGSYSTHKSHYSLEYKNKKDKEIIVYEIGVYKKNSNEVIKKEETKTRIKPYGINTNLIFFHDLNPDLVGKPFYRCKYGSILDKLF